MAPAKRHFVKLLVPKSFLTTLPSFSPTTASKSRVKRIVQVDKKSGTQSLANSQKSSPAPDTNNVTNGNNHQNTGQSTTMSQYKINVGLKEMSTAGLAMNSIASGTYALDKSGKPCRKWQKRTRDFKTFTGFKVKYTVYHTKDKLKSNENKDDKKDKKKEDKVKKEVGKATSIKVEG